VNGDTAKGDFMLFMMYFYKRTGQSMFWVQGQYDNDYVRENGQWKIGITNSGANLQALLNAGGRIDEVEVRRVTLDDVFLKFAGQQITDDADEHAENIFERIAAVRSVRK